MESILLAYSGGLDTSIICRWLANKGYGVICFIADVGQKDDLPAMEQKAMSSGASDVVIQDVKREFCEKYVWPAIGFNALYEGKYMLGTSLARPAIAEAMVREAKHRGISSFAHGATGKGNDQVRFDFSFYALMKDAKVVAPWRMAEFYRAIPGRKEALQYASDQGIPVKATTKDPWSSDENLFHISYESGILEDPNAVAPERIFEWTKPPKDAQDEAENVVIDFEDGAPIAVNGEKLSAEVLLEKLNLLGSRNGIGRIDIVESRYVGMKSRGVYETPGGTILQFAHREIESMTLPASLIELKDRLMVDFASLVYKGYWFSRELESLLAFLVESQKNVSGKIGLSLYKGNITPISRLSEKSLYDEQLSSMEDDRGAYTPEDAEGFIRLHALPLKLRRSKQG